MGMVPLSREGRRFKNLFSFFLDTLEGNRMSQAKFARLIALMRPLLKKRNGHPPTKKEEKLETTPHPTPTLSSPPWGIKFRPVVATLTQRWEDKVALLPHRGLDSTRGGNIIGFSHLFPTRIFPASSFLGWAEREEI